MPDNEEVPYERGAQRESPVEREDLPKARDDVAREDAVKGEGEIATNPEYEKARVEREAPSDAEELTD